MDRLHRLYENLFSDTTRRRIDCHRRRRAWQSRGVIFIHVPKAAGTSISRALYGRTLGHFRISEIQRWCPKACSTLFKFGIVRNPWDRVVSAYRFALQGATDTMGMWKPGQYRIPAFRSFEAFVEEWLVDCDVSTLDPVFQPQHLFVLDDLGNMPLDFLGKFEHLNQDMSTFTALTGIGLVVPELNRTAERGTYRTFYPTRRLVNIVGEIYARDAALFGYDF